MYASVMNDVTVRNASVSSDFMTLSLVEEICF